METSHVIDIKTKLSARQMISIQKAIEKYKEETIDDEEIKRLIVKAKESDKSASKWFQFSGEASISIKLQENHARPREMHDLSRKREETYFRTGSSESILFLDTIDRCESKYRKFNPETISTHIDFEKKDSFVVLQHEYAIAKETSIKPVLASFGAGPCLIVALYDTKNKVAVLSHVDSCTDLTSLPKNLFSEISIESTVAHLFGGQESSKEMCLQILDLIERRGIKIENLDIVRGFGEDAASLAIDVRTGRVYTPVPYVCLDEDKSIECRLKVLELQMLMWNRSPLRRLEEPT